MEPPFDIPEPRLRSLYDYWHSKMHGHDLPARADIDPLEMKQWLGNLMLIVLNLVITFAIPGISWQGHVGGLITGSLIACAYAFSPERYRTLFHVGVPVALLAVFVTLTVWRTEQLRSLITIVSS